MNPTPTVYISYLLRLWYAGSDDGSIWRAALENPRSGERQMFGDLAELFTFLEEKTRESGPHPDQPPVASSLDRGETHEC